MYKSISVPIVMFVKMITGGGGLRVNFLRLNVNIAQIYMMPYCGVNEATICNLNTVRVKC